MADDNYSRSDRDPRWPARPAARSPSGNDPLAELARLIGQTDPFSDFAQGRHTQAPQAPREQHQHEPRQHEPRSVPPPLDWASAQERYRQPVDPRSVYGHTQDHGRDDYRGYADPYADQGAHGYPDRFDRPHDDPRGYREDPQAHARQPHPHGYQQHPDDHAYGSDAYYGQMPHDEDMYEQPRPARRGGLVTVMAVLALAVLGTAAAFGYRAVFGTPSAPATPPVIKADSAPTKVVPATKSSDASGKLIYDRVGDPNQPEKLVSREEAPVNLQNAAPQPRVVLSNGITPQAPQSAPLQPQNAPAFAASPPAAAQPASPSPAAASTEPKKIRTVTIRPDQQSGAAPAPEPDTTQTARMSAEQSMPAAAAPRAPAAQNDQSGPLSLVPSGGAAPRNSAPMRTASAPVQQPRPTAGLQGAYSVQVTSQRSEAEAQASYRALQAQFPNVLGAQQAVIRRADLGGRGVYYRALVGSFESSDQASQFCRNLRDAGGQCVVQRN